jgi:hypothetical protein
VTEIVEAQNAIEESGARHRALATMNALGDWRATPEGDITHAEFWSGFTGTPLGEC